MKIRKPVAVIALVGIAGAIAAYFYWRSLPPPVAPLPAPRQQAAPAPSVEPGIRFPLPDARESKSLPALAESDSAMKTALGSLFGTESLKLFNLDGIVRRFVATIDNLPRQSVASRLMPVKPVSGAFTVSGTRGKFEIGADNALRYRPYLQVMEAVEAKRLVAAYVHFYPLFQAAYQELGYPSGYFNDRLVAAIDDMLAAPEVAAPKLVQPKVLYEFEDPDLEARSAGQKIMMRMGPANAARAKAKLRAIRRELTEQR